MRYIGNKSNLLEFIYSVVKQKNLPKSTFCDIFSGTTSVAKFFKRNGFRVISNDFMTYSYAFQKAYIENNQIPKFLGLNEIIPKPDIFKVISYLNSLKGEEDFIFKNYCSEGNKIFQRNYFSSRNAKKIDAIRNRIEEWKNKKNITENEFYILLTSLLESIPFVSNISGTYGAFLKQNDPRMLKHLSLKVPALIENKYENTSYKEDANGLIKKISCDILYIDPPYNERQYAPNYHILESVAVWDKKIINSKTGLRPYENQKSLYSYQNECVKVFEDLIKNANCNFILFSYNSDGIIPYNEIMRILSSKGKVELFRQDYRRFKSNSNGNKNKEKLSELLFFVKVNN